MSEYPQEVKERAYAADPECWISYSGKPKSFKQIMEARRTASLRAAQQQYDHEQRFIQERAERIKLRDSLDEKSKYAIRQIEKCAALMKSGTVTIGAVNMQSSFDEVTLTIKLYRRVT